MVNGPTKVITGNRDVDFVSMAPFEGNDEKIISDENVVNATRCVFPCSISKNFTLGRDVANQGQWANSGQVQEGG